MSRHATDSLPLNGSCLSWAGSVRQLAERAWGQSVLVGPISIWHNFTVSLTLASTMLPLGCFHTKSRRAASHCSWRRGEGLKVARVGDKFIVDVVICLPSQTRCYFRLLLKIVWFGPSRSCGPVQKIYIVCMPSGMGTGEHRGRK